MTHARLIAELAAAIKEASSDIILPLEAPAGLRVPLNVFENYLPDDAFEVDSYLPFVLVEFIETHDDLKQGSTCTIGLTVGVYAPERDAFLDALHIMEVLRLRLLTRRVIANRFRLTNALWQSPDVQPRPFFYLTGELQFNLFLPT